MKTAKKIVQNGVDPIATPPLNGALQALSAAEANLNKLEKLVKEALDFLGVGNPDNFFFGDYPEYQRLQREVADLCADMPVIGGMKLSIELMDVDTVGQCRLDYKDLFSFGEPEAFEFEKTLGEPLRQIGDYRHKLTRHRRGLFRREFANNPNRNGRYDVFLSYASEDKRDVAVPLVDALREYGLKVWHDETELKIGDGLRQTIDHGLAHSRFGVIVLSPAFFRKQWPNYELDGLMSGESKIFPVWHKVSKREVKSYSLPLAAKIARDTSTNTMDEIAAEIAEVIWATQRAGQGLNP